jgi:hypothetical protein
MITSVCLWSNLESHHEPAQFRGVLPLPEISLAAGRRAALARDDQNHLTRQYDQLRATRGRASEGAMTTRLRFGDPGDVGMAVPLVSWATRLAKAWVAEGQAECV